MPTLSSPCLIHPFLWFDSNAEEAAIFYVSIFPNSRLVGDLPDTREAGSRPPVLTVSFILDGLEFTALNGGPMFKFNESVSFVVRCETQAEIDRYWAALTANGGKESQCGWLKDKFGLSWQIVPADLDNLLRHPAAMQVMMKMKKFDIAALEAAVKD